MHRVVPGWWKALLEVVIAHGTGGDSLRGASQKKRLPGKQGSGGSGFETCTPVLSNITQMAQDNSKKVVILPRPPSVRLSVSCLPPSLHISLCILLVSACLHACAYLCVCVSIVLILLTRKMLLICVQLIESHMSFFHAFPPSTFLY